jgi:hypothetical protein
MASVPIIVFAAEQADAAWKAHQALLKAERDAPLLANMPAFTMAKQDAYERFMLAFGRV